MRLDIPVTPDADEARQWARDELAKEEYNREQANWLDRLVQWFQDLFSGFENVGAGTPPWRVIAVIVLVLAIIALVVWLVTSPMRRSRRAGGGDAIFGDDDTRTARDLRAAAEAAAASGDYATAVVERYRAIVRDLGQRAVLADRPGLTAYEAAQDIAALFPAQADAIIADAGSFDTVRYGHRDATAEDYAHVTATDEALERATVTVEEPV